MTPDPKPWPAWAADLVTPCGRCHAPLQTGEPVLCVGRYGFGHFVHAACAANVRRLTSSPVGRDGEPLY